MKGSKKKTKQHFLRVISSRALQGLYGGKDKWTSWMNFYRRIFLGKTHFREKKAFENRKANETCSNMISIILGRGKSEKRGNSKKERQRI